MAEVRKGKKRKIVDEKRVFNDEWTEKYMFVGIRDNCVCLVCRETISAVKEYNLRRHYETKHMAKYGDVVGQLRTHVVTEFRKQLNNEQQSLFKGNAQAEALTRASFKVAHLIVQSSRPFTDGDFVKKCMISVCDEICPAKSGTFNSVSLSRMTVQRRVDDIAGDIEQQLQTRASTFCNFALALDESTDVNDTAQLLVFVRGVDSSFQVTEELAGLGSMHGQTTGIEIFNCVRSIVDELHLPWASLTSVTTDGAPAMMGPTNGFLGHLRRHLCTLGHNQELFQHHCIIHQGSLCAKTLKFQNVMDFVFRSINFIRSRGLKHRQFQAFLEEMEADFGDVLYHTDVRWLSRGSVLRRFVALRSEIHTFLQANGRDTSVMDDSNWLADLCFLTDITGHLNDLNKKLQGKDRLVSVLFEAITSFQCQLQLFTAQLKMSNLYHFPTCRQLSDELEGAVDFTKYAASTETLMTEFSTRFHDFRAKKELYAVFADPLGVDVASLPPEMQLEVIDIQNCSSLRSLLREKGLIEFYKCLDVTQHQAVVANALKLVSTFGSSYICEQGFSVMNLNKSKLRSRLTDDHLSSIMRVACSNLSPDIGRLAANMKCNVSH